MKIKAAISIAIIAFPAIASTAGFTAVCEGRVGQRVYADKLEIKTGADSDSAPISFVYRDSDPSKMVMIWSSPSGNASASKTYEMAASKTSEDVLVAIDMDPGEVHVYSIYLKQGLLTHTMHRNWNLGADGPMAVSFMSKCKISEQK